MSWPLVASLEVSESHPGSWEGRRVLTEGTCQSPRPVIKIPGWKIPLYCNWFIGSFFFGLKNNPKKNWVGKDPNFTAMNQSILGNVWKKTFTWKNERFGHFGDRIPENCSLHFGVASAVGRYILPRSISSTFKSHSGNLRQWKPQKYFPVFKPQASGFTIQIP